MESIQLLDNKTRLNWEQMNEYVRHKVKTYARDVCKCVLKFYFSFNTMQNDLKEFDTMTYIIIIMQF